MQKHPLQPVVLVEGVARFKKNLLVRYLLDQGPYDLNHLARLEGISDGQFAQLIGYSVDGDADLSYADPEGVAAADLQVAKLLSEEI